MMTCPEMESIARKTFFSPGDFEAECGFLLALTDTESLAPTSVGDSDNLEGGVSVIAGLLTVH
jgi:hypothetical protein